MEWQAFTWYTGNRGGLWRLWRTCKSAIDVTGASLPLPGSPLSHHFRSGRFSITVKRAGLVSSLLFDSATPGDAVAFRGVGGSFTPVTNSTRPALLVAGGIGERRSAGIPQGRP
jgi:hypothetical protein